jgi:hypothetical protein
MSTTVLPRHADHLVRLRLRGLRPERLSIFLDDTTPEWTPGRMSIIDQARPTLDAEERSAGGWSFEQRQKRISELITEKKFIDAARFEWWTWAPELAIAPETPIGRLDLRCCKGLSVIVVARRAESEPRIDELLERLKLFGVKDALVVRLWLPNDDERCVRDEIIEGAHV